MEQWYVLHTKQGQEAYAESLVQKKISPSIYSVCRVLKKKKVFRSGGVLHILEDVMSVSYTHLDVYKRQVPGWPERQPESRPQ